MSSVLSYRVVVGHGDESVSLADGGALIGDDLGVQHGGVGRDELLQHRGVRRLRQIAHVQHHTLHSTSRGSGGGARAVERWVGVWARTSSPPSLLRGSRPGGAYEVGGGGA